MDNSGSCFTVRVVEFAKYSVLYRYKCRGFVAFRADDANTPVCCGIGAKDFFFQMPPLYHQFLLVFPQYPKYFYEIINICPVWLRQIATLSLESSLAR